MCGALVSFLMGFSERRLIGHFGWLPSPVGLADCRFRVDLAVCLAGGPRWRPATLTNVPGKGTGDGGGSAGPGPDMPRTYSMPCHRCPMPYSASQCALRRGCVCPAFLAAGIVSAPKHKAGWPGACFNLLASRSLNIGDAVVTSPEHKDWAHGLCPFLFLLSSYSYIPRASSVATRSSAQSPPPPGGLWARLNA